MSFVQCDQNMGNSMRVERIPVHVFNGSTGKTGAPIIPRGTVVGFEFDGATHQVKATSNPVGRTECFGVLAEAVVDHFRRTTRPNRNPTPLVLPVTMDGNDIATAEQPHTGFVPGDAVWYHTLYDAAAGRQTSQLCNCRDPPWATLTSAPLLVGTAMHNAPAQTRSVQLRVHGVAYGPAGL